MSNTAYLAHSTFQEDGISSLRLASTSNEDENIVSEFLTDNPKKYIYGTQYSKIDASDLICGGSVEGTSNRLSEQGAMKSDSDNWTTDTFILPNNGDVLSGIKFFYEFDGIHIQASTTGTNASGKAYTSEIGYAIIDTVTVYVGSNVWVETSGLDLYLRNLTETKNDLISELLTAGSVKIGSELDESSGMHEMAPVKKDNEASTRIPFSGMIDLKLFSEELQGFLQAGAPNEQIKIKISYNNNNVLNFFPGVTTGSGDTLVKKATLIGTPLNNMKIKKALYVRNNVFTKSERDHVRDNPIYKTLNISKSIKADHTITDSKTSKLLDLNSLDLDCSHLIVTILRSSYNGKIAHARTEQADSAYFRVFSKYDTSTHGPITAADPDLRSNAQKAADAAATATKSGTINCLTSLDLKINGASAYGGEVDPSFLSNSCKDLGLNDISRISNVYVLPLASKKFGDDSISLRRLRNKSLKVNFCDRTELNSPSDIGVTVYVTAVGYRPVSYIGGTSSLLFG